MSRRVDEILAVIDAGLQDSPEESYGDDLAGVCWRCQRADVAERAETCESCRLDLSIGPVHGPQLPSVPGSFGVVLEQLAERMAEAFTRAAEAISSFGLSLEQWQRGIVEAVVAYDVAHGRQPLCTTPEGCPQPCDDARCPSWS